MVLTNKGPDSIIRNAFYQLTEKPTNVYLASPFFSYADVVNDILKRNCTVKLIVRLSVATSPDALRKIIGQENIDIRFFTSERFHSKLYIFGSAGAIVGSANLTSAGLQSNQELAVIIEPRSQEYDDLRRLFQSYWKEAQPLAVKQLDEFQSIIKRHPQSSKFQNEIEINFGKIEPSGINVPHAKSKEKLFIEEYKNEYQEFLTAFKRLETIYKSSDYRKASENLVPLKLEIDMFLSYIRESFVHGDIYLEQPILAGNLLKSLIEMYITKWKSITYPYLNDQIPIDFKRIKKAFGNSKALKLLNENDLFSALTVCHSFRERRRFFRGGLDSMRKEFFKTNSLINVKKSLSHLLHGKGEYIERISDLLFDDNYKINQFGRANVQELFGWINNEDISICNGRTVKSLRFLGFDVTIFN